MVLAGSQPAHPVPLAPPRQGFVDDRDMAALLPCLPEPLRGPTQFAFLTGWRRAEVFGLRWAQVDFTTGVVRLEGTDTKNGRAREFPFDVLPELATLLRVQREHTTAVERRLGRIVPVVFHRNGRPIADTTHAWRRACARAGLPGLLFHDLRRSAVRRLERAGVPRSVATKLTGHLTESVYTRYAVSNTADLRDGVRKLAALPMAPAGQPSVAPLRPHQRTKSA